MSATATQCRPSQLSDLGPNTVLMKRGSSSVASTARLYVHDSRAAAAFVRRVIWR